MYINYLSNLLAFCALAAAFVAMSKLSDGMALFQYPNDASLLGLVRGAYKACSVEEGSLLHSLDQAKRSSLFILIDGYPEPKTYRSVTGLRSLLHADLTRKSDLKIVSNTYIDNTAYSLAYILAGSAKPRWFCRYPLFETRLPLDLLVANQYFSSVSSFCRDDLPFGWSFLQRAFRRYGLAVFAAAKPSPYIFSMPRHCTLLDATLQLRVLRKLGMASSPMMPKAHIFHEVIWHDYALFHKTMNLSGDQYASGLASIDKRYASRVASIIDEIKARNSVDDIFILSDHGPRLLLAKGQLRPVQRLRRPTRSESVLRNYYGFFVYYLPIKPGVREQGLIKAAIDRLAAARPSVYYEINRLGFPVSSPMFRP